MYKKIFVPLDNSKYSRYCTEAGLTLAAKFGAELTGSHVYSASLHDKRFKDMETGLPGHYREEERLKQSRKVHDSLIGEGLRMISDAYMESFRKACLEQAIPFSYRLMEGKNWLELAREVRAHPYDLVIIGILGLGAVNGNFIGGVCERVVRNISTDVLVVKNGTFIGERVVAAIDGSDEAFSAFRKALVLGKMFGVEVEALSVYDPHFHRRAFQALVGVLSEEAGKVFRFREQEKLHDEIIDDGLGKIYRGYLDRAVEMGLDEGVHVKSTLLAGKASPEICTYLEEDPSALLVISRFGAHKTDEQDIGNTAENLLRFARCNVLITHGAQAE